MPKEPNVVYIGRKPPMNYVLAVITSFTASNAEEVVLKARGQAITTAVNVAEIAKRRFLENVRVDNIDIGSEDVPMHEENRVKTVSTINITLTQIPTVKKRQPASPKRAKELTEIGGIGVKRAEKLKFCGVNSVQDLANSDPKELSEKLQVSEKVVSKWIGEAENALKD